MKSIPDSSRWAEKQSKPQESDGFSRVGIAAAYVLFAVYFIMGIFGRFPWKADEPYSFSIVWNMLTHGRWLVPYVGGDPFLEKPPLMFWLGALFAKALPGMAAHESSRLAVVACLILTAWALLWASVLLYREAASCRRGQATPGRSALPIWRLSALALLVGMPGLAEHAHKFTADVGQLAGATLALAALAGGVSRRGGAARDGFIRQRYFTGLLFGAGSGIAFLSKGMLVAGITGLSLLVCLVLQPRFRRSAAGFVVAAAVAAFPFIVPWPVLLYREDPALFEEWFWVNNIGRFIGLTELGGHNNPFGNRLLSLIACGAPATFLLAGLLRAGVREFIGRRRRPLRRLLRQRPAYGAVSIYLVIGLAVLLSSASMRDIYLLPVLPALALAVLPRVARTGHPGLWINTGVNLAAGMLAALIIATWISLTQHGEPGFLHRLWPGLGKVLPVPFPLRTGFFSAAAAVLVILLWWTVIRDRGCGLLLCWSAGLAMLWSTAFLLLMPWLDEARSYRDTFRPLTALVGQCQCLATDGLGESELGMLHYITGRSGVRIYEGWSGEGDGVTFNVAAGACDLLLVQDQRRHPQKSIAADWREIWRGHRPADNNGFILYKRGVGG